MGQINILYCFDSKFWRMAAVSMQTILQTAAPDTNVKIYAMVSPGTKGYRHIKKHLDKHPRCNGFVWHVVDPAENPFDGYEHSRWSPVIWYRLFAHRVFPEIDKILYLDSDTLVCRDLSELFNTDLTDLCIGAVRDLAPVNDPYHPQGIFVKKFSADYLNNGPYYNSGVLLLNLREIEKNEKLLFETKIPLYYPDQDLLNAAFVGKIKSLPLKYNLAPGILVPVFFPPEEAREALYGGHVIVHCYSIKPYYKKQAPDAVFDMFSRASREMDLDPQKFEKWEAAASPKKDTYIPHVKKKNQTLYLFGIPIKI